MKIIRIIFILGITLFSLYNCNTDDLSSVTSIEITHDGQPQEIFIGDTFVFQAKADNNTDVTDAATFNVDGAVITGNSFQTENTAKSYEVQAFYQGFESEKIIVSTSEGFVKNVLIEDYTGTWCGWCTRVAFALQEIKKTSDRIVGVAVHVNGSSTDPFSFQETESMRNSFGVGGLPEARINRIHTWSSPEPLNFDQAIGYAGISPMGIAIDSKIENNKIEATINIKYLSTITYNTKLVVYLLESGMLYNQTNYTNYFDVNYTDPLVNFEHNDVLREFYSDATGEAIPNDETINGNTYSKDFSKAIPSSIENTEHLHLVAFITNTETNEVINVREVKLGDIQDFQTN